MCSTQGQATQKALAIKITRQLASYCRLLLTLERAQVHDVCLLGVPTTPSQDVPYRKNIHDEPISKKLLYL